MINGAIPDRFWRRAGVHRSLNPTHPFAAWGKDAERYTEFHHRTLTMGPESLLGLLLQDDGFGLMLGVDYAANTFHHVVEMSHSVACLGRRTEAYPIKLAHGRVVEGRTWGWRASSCPFTDGHRYGDTMASRGL
jgi:aminoglycoside N3'-acetyltransferase